MQFQKPILRQEQKLKMTPQLVQAIKLMSLTVLDLRLKINEEIEVNPALEILEDKSTISIEDMPRNKESNEEYDFFENSSDPGYTRTQNDEDSDLKRKFIEGVLSRPDSLQDHLLWQLRLQPISSEEFRIGETIISNLDKNGFFIDAPENLVKPHELEILHKMIKMLQLFDPIGVCSKDYKEALLIQIANHPHPVAQADKIVKDYMEMVEKGKYKEICSKLKIKLEDFDEILAFLSTLDPLPGRNFTNDVPKYVIPDVMVRLKDGEFVIILNDEEIPVLGINPFFNDLSHDTKHRDEKELNHFVHSSIKNAKWFIQSINKRNSTLLKVCRALVEFQRDFFHKGPKYLVPLTLKDVADEVSVHEATVSRISNGKYIQTEWGIYEIKYFFSNAVSGTNRSGKSFSKQGVKEMMKEIIEKNTDKNLSDKNIMEILANRGVKIARRTVAKYRKELDIMSSYRR
ncbi:MAG: RNA polymerase factor sigma-54 [Spirochaetales bacterium]|nr:RNA polymerase factor sigma-54 [Spirochaetales bacterium]